MDNMLVPVGIKLFVFGLHPKEISGQQRTLFPVKEAQHTYFLVVNTKKPLVKHDFPEILKNEKDKKLHENSSRTNIHRFDDIEMLKRFKAKSRNSNTLEFLKVQCAGVSLTPSLIQLLVRRDINLTNFQDMMKTCHQERIQYPIILVIQ